MIKNFFLFGFRNILRQKWNSIVSISGLTLAIGLFTLIIFYIWHENNFDKFHENIENIYILESDKWISTPPPLANLLLDEFPEVDNVVRVHPSWTTLLINKTNQENLVIKDVLMADSSIFKVFTFDLIQGDVNNPFPTWNSMAISQSTSQLLFGNQNPIGKTLTINNQHIYTVTVLYEDLPKTSSIKANLIIPFYGFGEMQNNPNLLNQWGNWYCYTWLLTRKEANLEGFLKKLNQKFFDILTSDQEGWSAEGVQKLVLRPFKGLYFDRSVNHELPKGNKRMLFILSTISLLILIIACINFINLTTAKAFQRAKEVGLRKTVGANRLQLVVQFIIEVFLIVLISSILATVLVEIFLPEFNNLLISELSITEFSLIKYILISIVILFGVTTLAGIYPAYFLTSYPPISMISGEVNKGAKGQIFKKILIISQFTIAISLTIASILIYKQMIFMKEYDMGIDKEQVVFFGRRGLNKNLLREKLMGVAGIEKVSFTTGIPGDIKMSWSRTVDGKGVEFNAVVADPEYIEILGLEIIEGRNFSYDTASDSMGAVIFNQKAIKEFDIDNPLEKFMTGSGFNAPIIGVTKDFHFKSLHHSVEPIGIFFANIDRANICMVKISGNTSETIKRVGELMNELRPNYPFDYNFLDDTYEAQYLKEERLAKSFFYFTSLAIIIACIGLFAMASYSAENRVREISIRKVLGADLKTIIWLVVKDFSIIIVIANLLAWPIAYYAINLWFQSFPLHIGIKPSTFIIVGFMSFLVMLLTIIYKSLKVANTNPVEVLKYQ